MELPISLRLITSIYILHWHIAFHNDYYLLFLEEDIEINLLYLDKHSRMRQSSLNSSHPLTFTLQYTYIYACVMRQNIIPLQKYEKWYCCWQKEFSACTSKRLIWPITGVVPEKLIVLNAVGLSIANLMFPRTLIYEMIELKPAWPTFRRSFQALSTDTNRRNTPRSVWRPSHQTGFSNFTILFSLSFECLLMQARNTPKIKA